MYIRQNSLFSFDTLMQYQPQTRLSMLFNELDAYPAIKELPAKSVRGPKGYSVAALLRAYVAKQVCGIPTVTKLVERLNTDLVFRYDCGFSTIGSVPSSATFSRFFNILSDNQALKPLFNHLIEQTDRLGIISGDVAAIDASAIVAYEKTVPKKNVIDDGSHANWGAKLDTNGNQHSWFGYKLHLAVDTASELPLAVTVTPASHNDVTQAIPLIDALSHQPKYYCLDSGYDTKETYEEIRRRSAQAIIPLNRRGEKLPPEGLDENRTPTCSMGYSMVYWGCDAKKGILKFRCPHVCEKVNCPNGSAWCSDSNYGLVVKKKVSEDSRSFCTPHRGTREWEKLYNERTSVERVFSRLKEHLGANLIRVRGIQKVTTHLLLCCIALIAGTLAVNRLKKQAA
ncbi:transposase [Sporomusa sphaeroides]|uniref:transposase n=1 Tax=Sporomusa sphaeroides TaxID=47679 RepID=UPI002CFCC607|nr:transposase [Sporomusa sphaeroides]HML34177.1 transposase [Sporomusa sphaeroides]